VGQEAEHFVGKYFLKDLILDPQEEFSSGPLLLLIAVCGHFLSFVLSFTFFPYIFKLAFDVPLAQIHPGLLLLVVH
jgi:hypothetical protein